MSDDRSIVNAVSPVDTEITALERQVATARGKLPLQHDTALYDALSDAEIRAERELAEWIRAQRRKQRRRAVVDELAADRRDRRTGTQIRRTDEADARWHRKALAARRRVSSPDARLAQLYRRAEWSSRALIGVVVLGMLWAGVNVQRNLVPSGDMSDPLYWLSYGIEAMISIPIIIIMIAATTAARWGRELERGKVVLFELALLGTTVALNAGPHLASGSYGRAAEYAIAPVMVGVVIWLHAWVAARYAMLIEAASVELPVDTANYSPAERVASTDDHDSVTPAGSPERELMAPTTRTAQRTAVTHSASMARHEAAAPTEPTAERGIAADVVDDARQSTDPISDEATGAEERMNDTGAGVESGAPLAGMTERVSANPLMKEGSAATPDATDLIRASAADHTRTPDVIRPSADKSIAPGTLELIHKAAADHRRNGAEHARRADGAAPTRRRIPVTAAAQSTTGDATGTDPVPEATAHADTVARDPNGDTTAPQPAATTAPPVAPPEQLTLTTELEEPTEVPAPHTDRGVTGPRTPESPAADREVDAPAPTIPDPADDSESPENLDTPADDFHYDDTEVRALARQIAHRSPLRLTLDQIEEILELTDQSWSAPSIGAEVGVSGNTVTNIVEFARKIRHPYAFTG
ncbi:hypothetical protein BOX37_03765 [Nocardia mangyaensis]|uniref:Uncharacterized protein n=1 Tax=Nocardia mangyaensis TaxID=2213200 RepID=A0A1J0VMG4_9NOCA|nr:hypothetical protein [Nocardia mangyaensis]APE33228.1 hypothetical protein BOX37_03765 [Nocardia mangyaensis]